MKKLFLVTLALASSMALAEDIDYSRCDMFTGMRLDHDGKPVLFAGQSIKSQKREGNKDTYVIESSFGKEKYETIYSFEKDEQGRVIKAVTGGDRPSEKDLKRYRESMSDWAAYSAGGYEPSFWVQRKKTDKPSTDANPYMDPNFEMVKLSKLTEAQAKEVGIENAEELKRQRGQWKKDRRTARKLKESYSKLLGRNSLVYPLGSEAEFEIQDGACVPKSMSTRYYNSRSGQVNTFLTSSRDKCDKIRAIYQRNAQKVQECGELDRKIMGEVWEMQSAEFQNKAPSEGGVVGGAVHGGFGGAYLAGGIAGGYAGGLAGGFSGGYMGGMMGMGFPGGYGMGFGIMDAGSLQMQSQMCEYTYEFQRSRPGKIERHSHGGESKVQTE